MSPLFDLVDHVAGERISRDADEGSQADAYLAQQVAWAGDWGPRPVREALNGVGLFLAAAEDHLRSMSVLLVDCPPSAFAPVVLARAGLEASCKAWWMLEPGLTVRQFVCRHMSEQLKNLHEQIQFPPATIDEPDLQGRRRAILQTAEVKGITPTLPGPNDRWAPYIGEKWPWIGQLARDVLGDTLGKALYRFFSGVAHAASYSLPWAADLEGAVQVGQDAYIADLALPPPLVRQLVIGGGLSYVRATRRLYDFCGWPSDELEARATAVATASETWARNFVTGC